MIEVTALRPLCLATVLGPIVLTGHSIVADLSTPEEEILAPLDDALNWAIAGRLPVGRCLASGQGLAI